MHRPVWEYDQELIEPTPKCIREVSEAAGRDGWELVGMLAVMLPPSRRQLQERRTASGLMLAESVPDDPLSSALAAQMEAANGQPTPAVMLMFKRIADQSPAEGA